MAGETAYPAKLGCVTPRGFRHLVAGHEATVRGAEVFVTVPAPVLPQPGEKAAHSFKARILSNHQQRGSAFGTFHAD